MSKIPNWLMYKIVGEGSQEPRETSPGTWRFNLTEDGASWVDVYRLAGETDSSEFEVLWNLHPKEKGKVKIMKREIPTPRWQQSYLRPYWFSGMSHPALPLPEELQVYLDLANSIKCQLFPGGIATFNEVLINWYEDGSMYIGPHADDERELMVGPNGETAVWSLTLQDTASGKKPRTFRLKPKTGGKDRLDLTLSDRLVVVMGGTCQRTHKHQVPKILGKPQEYARRINITTRVFKD